MPTIKLRRGSRDQWTASNPILADGEMGVELDTGLLKVGNGFQHWDHLPYFYPNVSRLDLVRLEDRINQGLSEMVMEDISDVAFTTLQDGEAIVWSVDPERGDAFRNINLDSKYVLQNRIGNLLTPNQASVETDLDGIGDVNVATVTRDSTGGIKGSASMRVVCTQNAAAAGTRRPAQTRRRPILVEPGKTYTAQASVRVETSSTRLRVRILWWTASGEYVGSSSTISGPTVDVAQEWVTLQCTGVAPDTAWEATVEVDIPGGTVVSGTVVWHMDNLGLWEGAGGDWAMPGTPILNQGRRVSRPNDTDRLVEVWDGAAWVPTHYDSGWREVKDAGTPKPTLFNVTVLQLRRVNYTVQVRIAATRAKDGGGRVSASEGHLWEGLTIGFRPIVGGAIGTCYIAGITVGLMSIVYPTNAHGFGVTASSGNWVANETVSGILSFPVNDPIPTSLPGTMVTQAP